MCMAIRGTEEVGFRGEGFVEMVASSYCLMGNRNTAGRPWAKRGRIYYLWVLLAKLCQLTRVNVSAYAGVSPSGVYGNFFVLLALILLLDLVRNS